MNVKKYRAETTREALEQVKMDLGDDAFVLETKQVRTGGFLGLRTKREIEISAASANFSDKPEEFFQTASAGKRKSIELVDDTYAAPRQKVDPTSREKILNALAVRAASSKHGDRVLPRVTNELNALPETGRTPIEVVEVSSKAPQIVHPRNQKLAPVQPDNEPDTPLPKIEITRNDFEQIRAELREVKFTLNAFGNNAPHSVADFNFERDSAIFDYPFYDAYLELSKTGLDPARIRKCLSEFVPQFSNGALPAGNLPRLALKRMLGSTLQMSGDPLDSKRIMALIGATGVGKTTTIAKLAARATLEDGKNVELVTLDTYRIAAVEQLKTYAEIIGAGCHVVRSVGELDRTLERIGTDSTVLIDTTGRSPYDLSDQYEVSDYLLHNSDIHKCLAIQATLNSYDALAAIRKFEMYGADSLVLTKLDETARPGSILETAASSKLPVSYFCMGQRVPEDIRTASSETIADHLMPRSENPLKMSA